MLAGLLRCAHCGRMLHVACSGNYGTTGRYHCRSAAINHGAEHSGISFGSLRVDRAVSDEVLTVRQPIGVQTALRAIEQRADDGQASS